MSLLLASIVVSPARSQDQDAASRDAPAVSFAVMSSDASRGIDEQRAVLRAIDRSAARFVVHFATGDASPDTCSESAVDARRTLLDASSRPAIPVVAASEWADCGDRADPSRRPDLADAGDRLARIRDAFFASDESPGATRLRWTRQGAQASGRDRENVRWQVGSILFVSVNLPANNNDYRIGAGRNGEFEERVVANRAWLDRTFRIATERKLVAIVLFIDGAPGFARPLRAPEPSSRDRDGYYEWKVRLIELVSKFRGAVLVVQGHGPARDDAAEPQSVTDASGRPVARLFRVVAPSSSVVERWLRIDVDSRRASMFTVTRERLFDDPSGELYGGAKVR